MTAEGTIRAARGDARLGIGHLLLWMAGIGLALANWRWFLAEHALPRGEPSMIDLLLPLAVAAVEGAALAGCVRALWEWGRFGRFRASPGEWLLAASGAGAASDLAARWFVSSAAPHADHAQLGLAALLASTVVSIGVYARAFQRNWERIEWLPLFSAVAVAQTCLLVGCLALVLGGPAWYGGVSIAAILTAVACGYALFILPLAVTHDVLHHVRRDFLHWLGVFVFPLHAVCYFFSLILWVPWP